MVKINRVLFPENDVVLPAKTLSRSRLHATGEDSLISFCHQSDGCENKNKPSRKSLTRKGRRGKREKKCRSEHNDKTSRPRGRSRQKCTDKDGKFQRKDRIRRSRSMDSSILATLHVLQEKNVRDIAQQNQKNISKIVCACPEERGETPYKSRPEDKENMNPVLNEEIKPVVTRSRSTKRAALRRSSQFTVSVFENLPFHNESKRSTIVSPLASKSCQSSDGKHAQTKNTGNGSDVVFQDDTSDECLLSPTIAPKSSKRLDTKATPIIRSDKNLENTAALTSPLCDTSETKTVASRGEIIQTARNTSTSQLGILHKVRHSSHDGKENIWKSSSSASLTEENPSKNNTLMHRINKTSVLEISQKCIPDSEVQAVVKRKEGVGRNNTASSESPRNMTGSLIYDFEDNFSSTLKDIENRHFAESGGYNREDSKRNDESSDDLESKKSGEERLADENVEVSMDSSNLKLCLDEKVEGSGFKTERASNARRRRSTRNSRPVDRFIATFKRKRKRGSKREFKSPLQKKESSDDEQGECCETKNKLDQLRRSSRKPHPIARLIMSFDSKKNRKEKAKMNVKDKMLKLKNEDERRFRNADSKADRNQASKEQRENHSGIKTKMLSNGERHCSKNSFNERESRKSSRECKIVDRLQIASKRRNRNQADDRTNRKPRLPRTRGVRKDGDREELIIPEEWDQMQLKALKRAHATVEPTSQAFWEDVASIVASKSAEECRDKWFAMAGTPKARKKTIIQDLNESCDDDDDDADDIFNAATVSTRGAYSLGKALSDMFSSPILNKRKQKVGKTTDIASPILNRPLYKSYLKELRAGINHKTMTSKTSLVRKNRKELHAFVEEGDLQMRGKLSPGGTFHFEAPNEDEIENIYIEDSTDIE